MVCPVIQFGCRRKEIDKTIPTSAGEDVVDYEATIDRYIAEMERIQQEMSQDQQEIAALQLETRTMLAELLKAA